MSARRGYTLLELAVVMLLLAIAGGLAIPAFRQWQPAKGMAGAQEALVGATQLASRRALVSGEAVELVIDPARAHVWVHPRDTAFDLTLPTGCALVGTARMTVHLQGDGRTMGTLPAVRCGTDVWQPALDPLSGALTERSQ